MIGIQTKALFIDAYRELNARKMFWVVLVLNVLVVALFSAIGVKGTHISVFTWQIPQEIPLAPLIYKWIFSTVMVGRWLTWGATILALISTASIFPEFLSGGSIDLYLSKPIGRMRLFLTKYVMGLLFVLLQVTIFTVGSFVVLGWRGGTWEPGLFWAIPIVLLFFSYLFAICVFFGVLTRSTIASFFLTLVAWFVIFGVNQADYFLGQADEMYRQQAEESQRRLVNVNRQIADLEKRIAANKDAAPQTRPASRSGFAWFWGPPSDTQRLTQLKGDRARLEAAIQEVEPPNWVKAAQPIFFGLDTLAPKTQDTIGLLDRVLFTDAALQSLANSIPSQAHGPAHGWRYQLERTLHRQSMVWILGSSIAFEMVVLGLASWRFSRRDF